MARVFILTTEPEQGGPHEQLREDAAQDRCGVHALTDDPAAADLILFVDSWDTSVFFEAQRRHPLVRRYREKCFRISESPLAFPFLPGVYVDARKQWHRPDRIRTGFYLSKFQNPHVGPGEASERPYLFSFRGSVDTHPVRERILQLRHPRGRVQDTSSRAYRIRWEGTEEERQQFRASYGDELRRSQFVLCPRGLSVSSVRLFETMQTGRAPVIVSDDWVPPQGPDWQAFSLRVPEGDVARIPRLLEARAPQAEAMGRRARAAWEDWFAPEVSFHRLVEWCLAIQRCRQQPERLLRFTAYPWLLTSPYLKHYLGQRWRQLKDGNRFVL